MYLQVKWGGIRTEHATTPFLDKMYNHLTKTLTDFEVIICRWPEYILSLVNVSCLFVHNVKTSLGWNCYLTRSIFTLIKVIAEVENDTVTSLEVQYAEDIAPLTDIINPRRISFKYIQKLSPRSVSCYTVSDDVSINMIY